MILETQYRGRSAIVHGLRQGRVLLAANQKRAPIFFRSQLAQPVLFREALAALYHVVISDFKYRPKDRLAFKAWLEEQDQKFLAGLGVKHKIKARIDELHARLLELNRQRDERLRPFQKARQEYFDHVYEKEFAQECIVDPVLTVHPDEVAFEAFSRDESTYARLAAKFELFEQVDEFQGGTTNIDFSPALHTELEKLRSYRHTRFDIAPGGFTATTASTAVTEKRINLPDSWVMGFLQVHSTMTLGLTRFHMAPVDLFNICRFLRRQRTRKSPRALRYELMPGRPVRVYLEPWDHMIELTAACPAAGGPPLTLDRTPGAIYDGPKPLSIRTWGRDRLQTLARLLPLCRRVDVFLAGHGLPSVYVLDLGPLTFTLALSGWTDNDWTGGSSKFDLLARRLAVDSADLTRTYEVLRTHSYATEGTLANETGQGVEKTRSALSYLCQTGRAMYDLAGSVYRHRELFAEPFTVSEALKTAKAASPVSSPEEKTARDIVARGGVFITARRPVATGYKLSGSVKGSEGVRVRPLLHVNHEGQIIEAECSCHVYKKLKLTRGPCEHILALRLAHMDRLAAEDK